MIDILEKLKQYHTKGQVLLPGELEPGMIVQWAQRRYDLLVLTANKNGYLFIDVNDNSDKHTGYNFIDLVIFLDKRELTKEEISRISTHRYRSMYL